MKKRILYIFLVTLVSFVIWVIGEAILFIRFPDSSMTAARVWVIAVLVGACVWSTVHFRRAEKKRREDEENDHYKGVY